MNSDPNPDAHTPTGMCGSSKKCEACPSDFLCFYKAKKEQEIIKARQAGREPDLSNSNIYGWG